MHTSFVRCVVFALCLTAASLALAVSPAEPPPVKEEKVPPPSAEILAAIKAPAIAPVIKTKSGYTIELDLSRQTLSLNIPKKQIWISPEVEPNQTVEVLAETTPLKSGPRVLAQLKKGRLLYTSEVKGDWALVRVLEKGEVIRGYVRKTDLQPVAEEPPPRKSLALSQGNDFASAAMLIQKAKQFDDGLYAAVELATQEGQGSVIGKRIWLTELAGKVDAKHGGGSGRNNASQVGPSRFGPA